MQLRLFNDKLFVTIFKIIVTKVHETLLKLHSIIPNLGTLLILPFSVSKGGVTELTLNI
jgi:hypothetical protein